MTPRATSEQLVAAASAHVGAGVARVVHVGTGSGAIAIAVASACPHADVWATDNSRSAVLLARANARRHGLAGRSSSARATCSPPVPGQFDVIVANLPYLAASTATDYPELKANRSRRCSPLATASSSTAASSTPLQCVSPRMAFCFSNSDGAWSWPGTTSCRRSKPRSPLYLQNALPGPQ